MIAPHVEEQEDPDDDLRQALERLRHEKLRLEKIQEIENMHQELEMHKLQIEKQRLESQKAMQEERDRMQMEFGEAPDEDEDMMEP